MSSSTPLSRISQLSKVISESVGEIDTILTTKGLPSPSFDEDSLAFIPDEASSVADKVLDAAAELRDLLLDPLNLVYKYNGVGLPQLVGILPCFDLLIVCSTITRWRYRLLLALELRVWFHLGARYPSRRSQLARIWKRGSYVGFFGML